VSALPSAEHQSPSCGACGSETTFDGDDFVCEDCQLAFEPNYLNASFLNPEAEPCGSPCDNSWHGDHKIKRGFGYDCNPCQLPAGHESFHWTGCQSKPLTAAAGVVR